MPLPRRRTYVGVFSDDPVSPSAFWAENERGGSISGSRHDNTDALAAIQAAINSLSSTIGGKVELQAGRVFPVSSTVDISGKAKILIEGNNSVIRNDATDGSHAIQSSNLASTNVDYVTIQNIRITGKAGGGAGIYMKRVDYPALINVKCYGNGSHGIYLDTIDGTGGGEADPTILGGMCLENLGAGLYLNLVHDLSVHGMAFEQNTSYGIYAKDTYELKMDGCEIEDHANTPEIYLNGGYRPTITGCAIENHYTSGCIVIDGTIYNVGIHGCQIFSNIGISGASCVYSPGTANIYGLQICDNPLLSSEQKLIDLSGATLRDIIISGNGRKSAPSGLEGGIYLTGAANALISDMILIAQGSGVVLTNCSSVVLHDLMASCVKKGTGTHEKEMIYLGGTTTLVNIHDCRLRKYGSGDDLTYGIYGEDTVSDCDIHDNDIRNATNPVYYLGTIGRIRNNNGFVSLGEPRYLAGRFVALTENSIISIDNPYGRDMLVLSVDIQVSTGATATTPDIDAGIGSSPTADYATLFDDLPGESVGLYNSKIATPGTQTVPQLWKYGSGNRYLNMSIKGAAATGMAAAYVITAIGI